MDFIRVEALRCRAHVGVSDKERRRLQAVEIDLELGMDLKRAGRLDRVEATVDYQAVVSEVRRVVERGRFRLVEALAEAVAARLLSRFGRGPIRVRVRKFSVPGTASVGAEILRG